jgi:hypothetical protein
MEALDMENDMRRFLDLGELGQPKRADHAHNPAAFQPARMGWAGAAAKASACDILRKPDEAAPRPLIPAGRRK